MSSNLHVPPVVRTPSKLRLTLRLWSLGWLSLAAPCLGAAIPCVFQANSTVACLSWSRQAVFDGPPASLSGAAYAIRITGRAPGAGTIYDRTVDTLTPPAEDAAVVVAMAEAREAIVAASTHALTVSEPQLVESSSILVASVPLSLLSPERTVALMSFRYPGRFAMFCVGDLGEGPAPSGLLEQSYYDSCVAGASAARVGSSWPLYSPPWHTISTGQLDDTHLHTRLDVHRTVLFTGTLTFRHYELVGEDRPAADAGPDEGERP